MFTTVAVALLVTTLTAKTKIATAFSPKQFDIVTSLEGTQKCSVSYYNSPESQNDSAVACSSYTVNISSISWLPLGVPAAAACAWQCSQDNTCSAYNAWASAEQCQMFTAESLLYCELTPVEGCKLFQVCLKMRLVKMT